MLIPFVFATTTVEYTKEVPMVPEPAESALEVNFSPDLTVLDPVVQAIIKCESTNNPNAIGKNISKETGEVWSRDYGLMQVNDYYHEEEMNRMGLDIRDPKDSLEYGLYLYRRDGTKHWKSSAYCWSKILAVK